MRCFLVSVFTVLSFLSAHANAAAPAKKIKLALNWKAEPQFGGFYAAALNGEFKKRNLDVEIVEGGSGTPTVQMLAANNTDFGIVSAEEILVSRQNGGDVVGVFATYQTNPQAIMTHQSQGFASLKDVFNSDGTLAWQSGLSYAQFLSHKYPKSKIQKVPYTGGIASFVKNPTYSQQCFFTSEPLLAEKAGEKVKTFLVSLEGFNPYTTVLAVNGKKLKSDASTVKAMVEAVRAGWTSYLADPEPTNKKMAMINKAMDAATFTKSAAAQKPLIESPETKAKGLGIMTEQRWRELANQLRELQIIKKDLDVQEAFQTF